MIFGMSDWLATIVVTLAATFVLFMIALLVYFLITLFREKW